MSFFRKNKGPSQSPAQQHMYLSQAEILEDVGTSRIARSTLLVLSLTVFGAIGWASVAELRETVKATGEVVPTKSVQLVQHLEGGIVSNIRVREGQLVEKGSILAELAPAHASAEFETLRARRLALLSKLARLKAFINDEEPRFPSVPERYDYLIVQQRAALEEQKQSRREQRKILDSRLVQKEAEISTLQRRQGKLKRQIALLSERRKIEARMLKQGLISRLDHLATLESLNDAAGSLKETASELVRARESKNEAQAAMDESDASLRNKAATEASEATAEIVALEERGMQMQDRVKRLAVLAPARGIVQSLATTTLGSVIPPGGTIAEIVPIGDKLIVEAKISPNDIGHIGIGDTAIVKVLTYDFSTFGMITGLLEHISPTTFKEKDGTTFYKGRVVLTKNHVGKDPAMNLVLPGMVTQVEIESGARTIIEYLLHPVFQGLDTAMSER